jgi:hypothetical protein
MARVSLGTLTSRGALAIIVLAGTTAGCSWSRFDDVGTDAPVVLLKKPEKLHGGFGATIATASLEGVSARVLVGGGSGKTPAATFDLGLGSSPTVDATDTGSCDQSAPCYLASAVAGIGLANVGSDRQKLCFILGVGKAEGSSDYGLIGRCADSTEYTLDVPGDVQKKVIQDEIILQAEAAKATIRMSADKDEAAALVAGAPDQALAWYYRPDSTAPISLVAPGKAEDTYGAASAIVRLGSAGSSVGSRVVAVGAPDAGHVWLFGGDDAKGAPVGCLALGASSHFGRTLATGHVDKDDTDDLVIADDTFVTVISGKALAGLRPATDITCSLAALPPDAVIASFSCGSRDNIAGCPGGFGMSLAVGDLDGDGDGEVLVGAPGLSIRGTGSAGAVLVYDVEGKTPEAVTDTLFLSSQESKDALGSSLVAAHLDGRDVVVAGAPGSARAAVFYCSKALGGAPLGSRCE